ncbi:TPA: type VI secretion system lipoprotein TssJ [Pseudomonas aeruginosa]|nr:type VI secretion system lipoprotein TssJ [Pseudomonas aeruginosa]
MNRALSALLVTAMLTGCSTVGNVFKKTGQILMDPSIQVGAAEDQPSQVALSLYADPDVNPNAESLLPEVPVSEADSDVDGPFAIHLNSPNRSELIHSLRALLSHLEDDTEEAAPLRARSLEVASEQAPVLPIGAQSNVGQLPVEWQMSDDASGNAPLPVAAANVAQSSAGLAPGQYRAGTSLPDDPAVGRPSSTSATPIAFRIVQLKDDSMLLNASADQLQQDMKKVLGSSYLGADDYILVPGQYKFINFRPIREEANYIAVVADFHNPTEAVWKEVFRLEPKGRKYALLIALQGSRVSIIDESYRPAHSSPSSKQQ